MAPAAAPIELRPARFALVEVALPGRGVQPAGVILWDPREGAAALRLRRDFHHIATEEDLEVLVLLEATLEERLSTLGPERFFAWATADLSHSVRISDPEPTMLSRLDRDLMRLYRQHVPATVQRYETHLPVIGLQAAAGGWGAAMSPEALASHAEHWLEVPDDLSLDDQMFLAQVVGRSMEPLIPDGSLCVFRYQPAGSREGRRVLVENLSDYSNRYTVKVYRSARIFDDEGQVSARRVRLEPLNKAFPAWELDPDADDSQVRILGEFLRVLEP